jgi:hypothetical protein
VKRTYEIVLNIALKWPFPGRRPDQCRFKPGDIVEYVFNDTVTLGIVMECPPTPEDVADKGSRCSRYNKPFEGKVEYEEDAYTILSEEKHHHHYPGAGLSSHFVI